MQDKHRSGCPINLTLEMLGDRWSLIVIRDIIFGNRRRYRELLTQSEEGIASNVLADRLKRLVAAGLLSKADDLRHKQSVIYSLTEPAIQLVPLLAQMGAWGTPMDDGPASTAYVPPPVSGPFVGHFALHHPARQVTR